jgi:archaellum component FlaC
MTDDLVKRLRNNCSCNFSSTPCGAEEECRNAFEGADRIEKLEAENEELQSKVGTVRLAAKYAAKIRDDRIEKLEAALREIVGQLTTDPHEFCDKTWDIARKALEGKDD